MIELLPLWCLLVLLIGVIVGTYGMKNAMSPSSSWWRDFMHAFGIGLVATLLVVGGYAFVKDVDPFAIYKTETVLVVAPTMSQMVTRLLIVFAVSVSCGYFGQSMLTQLKANLFSKLGIGLSPKNQEAADIMCRCAKILMEKDDFVNAHSFLKESFDVAPSAVVAGTLAYAKKRLFGAAEALKMIDTAWFLSQSQDLGKEVKAKILFNRACYRALIASANQQHSIEDLRAAIDLDVSVIQDLDDDDLKSLAELPEFKALKPAQVRVVLAANRTEDL